MQCLGIFILIIGLILLAILWPPILIIYIIVGGMMLIGE